MAHIKLPQALGVPSAPPAHLAGAAPQLCKKWELILTRAIIVTCPNTDIDMICNPNQSNVSHRMDVLGACNLCLDEGQVLGVGGVLQWKS